MKNTIVKLLMALAMCFMIGGALVACAGADGKDGKDGKDGVDGHTPKITINDEGYWCVDGESTGIKAEGKDGANGKDGEDLTPTCDEHTFVELKVIKNHTKDFKGEVLKYCSVCTYVVVVGQDHNYVALEGTAATCDEPAYVGGEKCTICGDMKNAVAEGTALGHDWTDLKPVEADGETVCEDGGIMAKHCKRCFVVSEPVYTNAIGHTVEANGWALAGNVATGICKNCNNEVTYTLPELNADDYTVVGDDASCVAGATKTYTYIVKNEMNDDMVFDTNIVYTAEVPVPAIGHQLAGKNFVEWAIDVETDVETDGVVLPYYVDGEELGLKEFADHKFECQKVEKGYFICSDCNEAVYVYVYMEHNGEEVIGQEATCYAEGYKYVDCFNCDAESERVTIEKIPHTWAYTLFENEDGTFTLAGACTVENCGALTEDVVAADDIVTVAEADPSCLAEGYKTFYYVVRDAEGNVIAATDPVTVIIPKTAHTLAGKLQSEYDVIYSDLYVEDTEGNKIYVINEFADIPFAECGKTYKAYYICSVCKAAAEADPTLGINPVVYVDVVKAHNLAETIISNPTCTVPGSKNVACQYDNCNYVKEAEEIEALGHDWTFTYELSEDNAVVTITATCSRGCTSTVTKTLPALDSDAYDTEITTTGTCNIAEIVKYTIVLDGLTGEIAEEGVEVTFSKTNGTADHNLDTENVLETEVVKENGTTYKYTFYYCKDCGIYVVIDVEEIAE